MLLRLENICKDYLQGSMKVPALKNIQLHIRAGEYVAIMGPSGSGKSTLMNIIGLLDKPTSGQYEFEGKAIMDRSEREMTKLRLSSLGFVFQNFQLMGKQSALSNVEMPLIYAGVKKKERIERAAEALRLVGLEDRARFKPVQLSGGQVIRGAEPLVHPLQQFFGDGSFFRAVRGGLVAHGTAPFSLSVVRRGQHTSLDVTDDAEGAKRRRGVTVY